MKPSVQSKIFNTGRENQYAKAPPTTYLLYGALFIFYVIVSIILYKAPQLISAYVSFSLDINTFNAGIVTLTLVSRFRGLLFLTVSIYTKKKL